MRPSLEPVAGRPHFPNDAAITRLDGALLLEHNHEWAVPRARSMTLETMVSLRVRQVFDPRDQILIFLTPMISLPVVARGSSRPVPEMAAILMASYTTPRDMIAVTADLHEIFNAETRAVARNLPGQCHTSPHSMQALP